MGARRLKSQQVSDTSEWSPHDRLTFVVDQDLGKNLVRVLQERGVDARFLSDCGFPPDTPEEVWMPAVAAKGWVALSKDENIRRRAAQQSAIRRSKLRLFLLLTKKVNRDIIAEVFTGHWAWIERFARETPAPFIAGVNRAKVGLLDVNRAWKGGH